MTGTHLAIIADAHANAFAVEAVLADIARRGITTIVNLGDNANGPIDPVRTVALLRERVAWHVRGNGDRMTGEGGPTARKSAQFARDRLEADALRWLRDLPQVVRGDDWVAFHASPRSDVEYTMENIVGGKTVLASAAEIAARVGEGAHAGLVLCGHTHLPRLARLGDGRFVLNPGSVGLPAYRDDEPTPHAVENGSPHARYAIARRDAQGWAVEFVCLPYDSQSAAAAARAAGWNAWANNLETGYARA